MAAHSVERICYGLEISPEYVDTIVERWQRITGTQAVLDGTDHTFDQVRAERRAGGDREAVSQEEELDVQA